MIVKMTMISGDPKRSRSICLGNDHREKNNNNNNNNSGIGMMFERRLNHNNNNSSRKNKKTMMMNATMMSRTLVWICVLLYCQVSNNNNNDATNNLLVYGFMMSPHGRTTTTRINNNIHNNRRSRKVCYWWNNSNHHDHDLLSLSNHNIYNVRLSATTATTMNEQDPPQSSSSSNNEQQQQQQSKNKRVHTLVILTMPVTSRDRIANEAILETAMCHLQQQQVQQQLQVEPSKLSVVLRCRDDDAHPSLAELRSYVGEVYSMAWDCALGLDDASTESSVSSSSLSLPDVIVYPAGLPNLAPETWIHHQADLTHVCSHDSFVGWSSPVKGGTGKSHQLTETEGGLHAHVDAINHDRSLRSLPPVQSLFLNNNIWPLTPDSHQVIFLEDETTTKKVNNNNNNNNNNTPTTHTSTKTNDAATNNNNNNDDDKSSSSSTTGEELLTGKYVIPYDSLFESVAVGGTWDGMHYGHRKLLTLAVSSVVPSTGKLLIGVTRNSMLQSKSYSHLIPTLDQRIADVTKFMGHLAPGLKNRIKVVPIHDTYGPPGSSDYTTTTTNNNNNNNNNDSSCSYKHIPNDFDALVLSHETLATGQQLNQHRTQHLNLPPLTLLCTRRTEPHGMSSTALRRIKQQQKESSKHNNNND